MHKIGRDIFSICEEYDQKVGEGILEHYNKEMERTDEKYLLSKLFAKKSGNTESASFL